MVQRLQNWVQFFVQLMTLSALGARTSTRAAATSHTVSPPPVPSGIRFYGHAVPTTRYRLQTTEMLSNGITIWDRYGWAVDVDKKRVLCLFALPLAGVYSTPEMRQTAASLDERRNYILRAVCYLMQDCPTELRTEIGLALVRPEPIPKRYRFVNDANSFCNIFINDVTRLLHCELPNNPDRTLVRDMYDWLNTEGIKSPFGWEPIADGRDAQHEADQGRVVVMFRIASVKDAQGNSVWDDHVALVLPSSVEGAKVVNGKTWPRVAQAGMICGSNLDSYETFFHEAAPLKFFAHD